jgi:NADH:ubiquinone reductase (H+-translocating)
VDTVRQEVVLGARRIPFDFLVLATGSRHAYFGHDDWELHAHGIKKIDDATFLRRKILLAFERAESESDPSERRRLLTFVVIGGGATGVEVPARSPSLPARRWRPISAPSIRARPV